MFSSLFDPTSPGWRAFARFMDLFGLSLCWLMCSIPVLTLGASTTALYDAVYHGLRRREEGTYARFFTTFRRELRTAVLVTLPWLAALLGCWALYRAAYLAAVSGSRLAGVLVYAYQLLFCIPLAVWLFACATLSRFTFGPAALCKTACRLVFSHLPSAVLVAVLAFFCAKLMLFWPFSFLFLPALTAWLASFPLERVFAPYLEKKDT